jgi:hypothetical protein
MLNSQTGYVEPVPILSAAIARNTLSRLNLDQIDPSNAMKNFVHNMAFKPRNGFFPVETLATDRFAAQFGAASC